MEERGSPRARAGEVGAPAGEPLDDRRETIATQLARRVVDAGAPARHGERRRIGERREPPLAFGALVPTRLREGVERREARARECHLGLG